MRAYPQSPANPAELAAPAKIVIEFDSKEEEDLFFKVCAWNVTFPELILRKVANDPRTFDVTPEDAYRVVGEVMTAVNESIYAVRLMRAKR